MTLNCKGSNHSELKGDLYFSTQSMIGNKDQPFLWESWLSMWNYKDDIGIDKDIDRNECVYMDIYVCIYCYLLS